MKTREERRLRKIAKGECKIFPVSLVSVNFQCDKNLGGLIRAAGCFGAQEVVVIGHMPDTYEFRKESVGLHHHVPLRHFRDVMQFCRYYRDYISDYYNLITSCMISVELTENAVDIRDFTFPEELDLLHTYIVVGNESTGVPIDILQLSDYTVKIPMPGIGTCLNTSQAANIILYEYMKSALNV